MTWEDRAGSDNIRIALLKLLLQPCKDKNSSEDFRDLQYKEITAIPETTGADGVPELHARDFSDSK